MMQVCVTRFNNKTIEENKNWKKINNEIGCIYGTPIKISDNILPETTILVLEMNNSINKIEGIGIIKNKLMKENKKYYKIYSDNNYNRFIYKSNYRIDKSNLTNSEKKILENLEDLLFKHSTHCKRGQGIQKISNKVKKFEEFNYIKFLIDLYNKKFINIINCKLIVN
tara:strand:- start:97 stop:600 length:504 start_codon:yes stop_codon:yes gene_type:complete